jgi:hypothetical protein
VVYTTIQAVALVLQCLYFSGNIASGHRRQYGFHRFTAGSCACRTNGWHLEAKQMFLFAAQWMRRMSLGGFKIIGDIKNVETIAAGNGIRDLAILRSRHGLGNWRKKKGVAILRRDEDGVTRQAELHRYEAHGIGKVNLKIKEWL